MLISTMTIVALRCPSCGRLEFRGMSLFCFSGGRTWQVECSCGTVLLKGRKKGGSFLLHYHCLMCDCFHYSAYRREEIWSRDLLTLICSDTDLEIGFIGPRDKVHRAIKSHDRSLAEMAEDLGFNDFFEEPDVMYRLLSFIYQLAEQDNLHCGCGNDNIEVEIFPAHLQLRCDICSAEMVLPAGSYSDLDQVTNLKEICLPGNLAGKGITAASKQRWRRRRRQKSPV